MRRTHLAVATSLALAACGADSSSAPPNTGPDPTIPKTLAIAGRGTIVARYSAEVAKRGDYAYTTTWGQRGNPLVSGDAIYIWRVAGTPQLVDSVIVPPTPGGGRHPQHRRRPGERRRKAPGRPHRTRTGLARDLRPLESRAPGLARALHLIRDHPRRAHRQAATDRRTALRLSLGQQQFVAPVAPDDRRPRRSGASGRGHAPRHGKSLHPRRLRARRAALHRALGRRAGALGHRRWRKGGIARQSGRDRAGDPEERPHAQRLVVPRPLDRQQAVCLRRRGRGGHAVHLVVGRPARHRHCQPRSSQWKSPS